MPKQFHVFPQSLIAHPIQSVLIFNLNQTTFTKKLVLEWGMENKAPIRKKTIAPPPVPPQWGPPNAVRQQQSMKA